MAFFFYDGQSEDMIWLSLRLTFCFNSRYIAVNRNSPLTTEKNDILNFLNC